MANINNWIDGDKYVTQKIRGYVDGKVANNMSEITYIKEMLGNIEDRLLALEGKELPSNFQEVEYIDANNGAYINTGLTLNGSYGFYMEMRIKSFSQVSCGMVAHNSTEATNGRQGFMVFNTASHKIAYFWCSVGYRELIVDSDIDFTERFSVMQDQNGISVEQNDIVNSEVYSGTTHTNSSALELLHSQHPNHNTYYNGVIYKCRVRKDDEYIRDFKPVIRISDGVAGLYDEENMMFYPSVSSTPFLAGPVVS